jgi:hypothetical protein
MVGEITGVAVTAIMAGELLLMGAAVVEGGVRAAGTEVLLLVVALALIRLDLALPIRRLPFPSRS